MELSSARQEGFVSKSPKLADGTETKKRPLVVIGIMTSLGNKKKRDAVRQAWMGTGRVSLYTCFSKTPVCYLQCVMSLALPFIAGASLKKLESEKGVIARFVIGRRFGFCLSLFDFSMCLKMIIRYWNLVLRRCFCDM